MAKRLEMLPFRMTMKSLAYQIDRHWCLASYLILNARIREIWDPGEKELPATFSKEMAKHVYAYIYEDTMPPAAIAQTVLNVSEDLMAGRQVQLRAGDYIAVQNFMRGR